MKGIELTRSGQFNEMVWIPLNSIALVRPYIGFDTKESGTEITLNNNDTVHVNEGYATVIEELQKL